MQIVCMVYNLQGLSARKSLCLQGWTLIEEVILDFESQMKEAVNEEHEGKRKCELNWKVHRIHWEKNRFIYDLMYVRKVMSRELVSALRHVPCSLQH